MARRRRKCVGYFNLPCGRKEYPVKKDDFLDLKSKEECPVKNDPLGPKSNEEFHVENELLEFTLEELSRFTSQFSSKNLIGLTYFGKLYRGKMPIASDQDKVTKDVTVKILVDDERNYGIRIHDDELPRLEDELKLLQAPKIRGNPNLVKVVGYCRNSSSGRAIAAFFTPIPFLESNETPIHDVVNWVHPAYNVKSDVYAFGISLYNLLSKRALDKEKYTGCEIDKWAANEYKHRRSYVDRSLEDDTYFDRRDGRKLTELARQCMDDEQKERPEMKEVFERLKGLRCCAAAVL
ncbi:hypothetical protein MTR67_006056 [Solanum verrucosum]|uniref:Serine-threonine/tyrosine-protein kinase catalytic domain-containing protein n=1 Tax=Solanum verrucosum TaxID=315347 RepID=A0AAF0Q2E3_SOLVR|nr:hypothetical protein MTR67_006056 [Solanum verrucosum]